MTAAARDLASGKGHRDENFPVASALIRPAHRAAILTFYRFARTADDIADHPDAAPAEKLRLLAGMRATLTGETEAGAEARALRAALARDGLDPRHALDLLVAFERDVTVRRYADWAALIDYCAVSAMPVGRFVLDVHGESRDTWAASDALCAALQIINHLQDCAKDFRALERVYLPLDALETEGASAADLGAARASPGLRRAISGLATRTGALLDESAVLSRQVRDRRLSLEIAVIQRLARSLVHRLMTRDPLCERVHHSAPQAVGLALLAAFSRLAGIDR